MFPCRANFVKTAFLLLAASLGMTTMGAVPAAKRGESPACSDEAGADSNWSDLSASMETMHRSMAAVRPSKDSDLNFVNLMLPHHEAAIEMAKAQLKYGSDPQIRRLAQEIIADQESEIELMRLWLKQHHGSVNPEASKNQKNNQD